MPKLSPELAPADFGRRLSIIANQIKEHCTPDLPLSRIKRVVAASSQFGTWSYTDPEEVFNGKLRPPEEITGEDVEFEVPTEHRQRYDQPVSRFSTDYKTRAADPRFSAFSLYLAEEPLTRYNAAHHRRHYEDAGGTLIDHLGIRGGRGGKALVIGTSEKVPPKLFQKERIVQRSLVIVRENGQATVQPR